MSKRYKILIEYDGRPYVGWQRQINGVGVQGAIETAIKKFTGSDVTVIGSGRTDTGVHACGQVAHFDLNKDMQPEKIMGALNFHLGDNPISILHIEEVSEDFNARFSAKQRHYTYKILNRHAEPTFNLGLVWHVYHPLDAVLMHEAAQILVGTHDFTTFRSVHCQSKNPIKTMDALSVERRGNDIWVHASAKSFLHHQIRSITGCLKLVGAGRWTSEDLKAALYAKDRAELGFNAPPDGLYFMKVDY
jgi:tRNA pseudouridine38-40 synthase